MFLLLKKKNKIHNAQLTFQSLLYLEIVRTFYKMPAEFIKIFNTIVKDLGSFHIKSFKVRNGLICGSLKEHIVKNLVKQWF